jgi:peptidoglycan/LPS O-acetylase OafA/YrhL
MSAHTPASAYRPDIDGLRALAVVPVIFFHAGLPLFSGGFVGVSVFFVISGYLMASMIGEGLARGDFSFADFYERRARRIFPALFVVLFFCAIVAVAVVPPRLFGDFGVTLVATVLFASNIAFWWKSANYFDTPSEWNPLLHTWSLAVEEQFYILFPLFLVLVWRFGRRARWGLTALAAAVSLLISVWGTVNAPTATFYLLPTRAWELLLGALLALATRPSAGGEPAPEPPPWISGTGGLAGLALVLASLLWFDREMAFPGLAALVPTAGAALLIHSGRDCRSPAARLLALAPFTFIGRISYSLYLWHWPFFVFAEKYYLAGPPSVLHKASIIALSGVAAYLSWRWVEQPFRGRRSAIGRTTLVGASAGCMAALGLAGALAHANHGWPARFPGIASVSDGPQYAAEAQDVQWQHYRSGNCFADDVSAWSAERCFLSRHAPENALLWGDSFAASYAYGFFRNERSHLDVLEYTSPSCPPITGYRAASRPQCAPFNDNVAAVIRRYRITTVIMAANWSIYLKRAKMRYGDIERTVAYLRGLGVRVILVGQSPLFPFAYPDEYFFRTFGTQQADRAYYAPLDVAPDTNLRMASIAAQAVFFDPLALLCHGTECVFRQGRLYLFYDYGHYTHYGSRKVVNALLDAMKETPERTRQSARN